jgi:hypothetical protein
MVLYLYKRVCWERERERERERVLNKSLKWLKRILESGDDNSLSLVPVNSKIPR